MLEIAMPPAPSLAVFAQYAAAAHAAAAAAGLSPLRWRWNGEELDSGGGGQLTFGGPTPDRSPFFAKPRLLPSFLRYLNRHPALSFAFAPECVGGASQGPRPDEGSRERFDELGLALDLLGSDAMPAHLASALGPLLVDGSGNSHRAEVNVEKLWNPALPDRGHLGLVELRALRMEPNPERATAVAAVFRALLARLAVAPFDSPLFDWGAALHDRFGLPSVLLRDLVHVLDDLAENQLAPGERLREMALAAPAPIADVVLGSGQLVLTPAIEFWPLVGDVASQERLTARVVDSSTRRIEIRIRVPPGESPGLVHAEGRAVALHPLAREPDAHVHVGAVRFRSFVPSPGFHPGLSAVDPLVVEWSRGRLGRRIELHSWIPGGGVYEALPADGAEAA
ncbi:MAG: transglutaminase family protein, partial [Candidatus Binatia bacterium]